MTSFDAAELGRRLNALEFPRAVAFTAACAQRRRAVGVRILEAHGRSDDAAAYDLALERLWSTARTESPAATDAASAAWARFDALPEFEAEEESSGELAYSEDAIVTLGYATQFARGDGAANAVYCASRSFDAAGFLGKQTAAATAHQGSDLEEAEARIQLEDLADLEGAEPLAAAVERIRARAQAEGERAAAAAPHPGASA
jgi:hypothetical protein